MRDLIERLTGVTFRPPATTATVEAFQTSVGVALPADYLEFLRHCDGGEGEIGPHYVSFWSLTDMAMWSQRLVTERIAHPVLIGGNGAGEGIGLDFSTTPPRVVLIDLNTLQLGEAMPIGSSFTDFLERLLSGKDWFDYRSDPS